MRYCLASCPALRPTLVLRWGTCRRRAIELLREIGDHPGLGCSLGLPPPLDTATRPTAFQQRVASALGVAKDDFDSRWLVENVMRNWSISV
jgi:hypothetical protein